MALYKQIPHLIIGAGPAGLQLAYFLQKKKRSYLILEAQPRAGSTFEKYPRHGRMISINKVYTGYEDSEAKLRYDWNSLLCDDESFRFTQYTKSYFPDKDTYARYLRDFAARFELAIRYRTKVTSISRAIDGNFIVETNRGEQFKTPCLVVATGISNDYRPAIPGIEHAEAYSDMSIDPESYANQRVLILGKGNSAFETANHLSSVARAIHLVSPNPLKLAWNTHFFGHLRAVNNDFLDTYILKGQNSVLNANVLSIRKVAGEYRVQVSFTRAGGQLAEFAYDRVLCCTGFRFDSSAFAPECTPELTPSGRLPAMTSAWESTNLPGLFYAGTITQSRDYQKTMSSVLHGFRSNVQALFDILEEKYYHAPIPSTTLPLTASAIADRIIGRVSRNPGMMHQPGFLGDFISIDPRDEVARYHNHITSVDYALEHWVSEELSIVVTMEYGHFDGDIFGKEREPDPKKAYDDAYLHPRIRCFEHGRLVAEHHMSESLENDWRPGEHPGKRALIRKFELKGGRDATRFNHIHRQHLIRFLRPLIKRWSASSMPVVSLGAFSVGVHP